MYVKHYDKYVGNEVTEKPPSLPGYLVINIRNSVINI